MTTKEYVKLVTKAEAATTRKKAKKVLKKFAKLTDTPTYKAG